MPRTINFDGRVISVPDDFSDDDVAQVLASGSAGATSPQPSAAQVSGVATPPGATRIVVTPQTPVDPMTGSPMPEPQLPAGTPVPSLPGGHGLQVGTQGAARGLGELLFAGPDLVNTGVNLGLAALDKGSQTVGGPAVSYRFPMASTSAANLTSDLAEKAGVPVLDPEKMSVPDKLAYNTNRMGAQVAGAIPVLARAGMKRAADIATGEATPVWYDNLVKPYGQGASARTVRGDMAGAAGAGAGLTASEQLPQDQWYSPLANLMATILGGLGGATAASVGESVPKVAGMGVRKMVGGDIERNVPIDPQTGNAVTKHATNEAARVVQQEAVDKEGALARIFQNVAELEPYLQKMPSPAALAEDPGLAALERQINMAKPGEAIARQRQFQSGVRDTIDRVAPEGATVEPLVNRAQSEIDTRRNAAQGRVDQAQTYVDRTQRVRGEQSQEVTQFRGQKVPASEALDREIVREPDPQNPADRGGTLDQFDRARRDRYTRAPNVQMSGESLYDAAQEIRAHSQTLPPNARASVLPESRLADFESYAIHGDPEDPTRITGFRNVGSQDLERLRPQIHNEIAAARRNNAPPELIDNLRRIQNTIQEHTQNLPANAEANRFYTEDYAPVFGREAGEAYRFRQDVNKDRLNRTSSPPSETAGRFIRPDAPEKTAALQRILDGTPDPTQAQDAVRRYMMADLAEKPVLDPSGVLRPNALRNWAVRNEANLDLAPGLRDQVNDLIARADKGERIGGRFADELQNARREQRITEDQIKRSAFSDVVGADPDKAVASIMQNPNSSGRRLRELIDATANDPAARDGLKVAVRDYLIDRATTTASEKLAPGDSRGPVSFAKLTQIFNEHEAELAQVFSPDEMNTLRAGHKALELANVERVRAGSGSDTMEKGGYLDRMLASPLGKGVDAFLRLKYGILKAGGLRATARRIAGGIGSEDAEQITRLVERATVDPELMGLLLGRDVPVASSRWNSRMNAYIGTEEFGRTAAEPPKDEKKNGTR
jgi:hypothetical protein